LTRTFVCVLVLAMNGAGLFPNSAFAQGAASDPAKIVVLGDSLSAGLGLAATDAFPEQLEKALKDKGINVEIGNAGVSGDTASGGLDRLDWSVPVGTQGVILELGANDALRGTDPKVTRAALDEILKRLKARNIAVLLCGMVAPPNYGTEYAAQFNTIYPDLAKKYDVPLYPFFLDGVAANTNLNQPDGMHPTAAGVAMIVKNILPAVEAFLGAIHEQKG
jgi:acyl-CoA thioesterase-1